MRWARLVILTVGACSFEASPIAGGAGDSGPPADAPGGDDGGSFADSSAPADAAAPDGPAPDTPPACPPGYARSPTTGGWYRAGAAPAMWLEAEAACEADGAGTHLIVLGGAEDVAAYQLSAADHIWIGASDRRIEGTWRWVTGAAETPLPVYLNPDPEDCGVLDRTLPTGPGRRSALCDRVWDYVCECDEIPADPTSY